MAAPKGPKKEYTSVSPADVATFAPVSASWVQIIGAGTTVLTAEDTSIVTITTDAAEPVACIPGPFVAFTSTTAARVRMGVGLVPRLAPPATAVPATSSALGGVSLSVAPAVAANPIVVGTNDPRVCTVEAMIDFAAADGVFVESTVWIPGVVGTITGASLSVNASVTQSDTNYLTYTLGIRDGAGGGASTVASQTTKVTAGGAFLGFVALTLGAITNATTAAISQVTFKSVKTGTGQAATGQGLLRITYTVP